MSHARLRVVTVYLGGYGLTSQELYSPAADELISRAKKVGLKYSVEDCREINAAIDRWEATGLSLEEVGRRVKIYYREGRIEENT